MVLQMRIRKDRQRAGAKLGEIGSDFHGGEDAVSGQWVRSLAPDMTSNEVVLSASEGDDGESGHLALQ
ncbi:hypothetical protein [Variovorax gossypii]